MDRGRLGVALDGDPAPLFAEPGVRGALPELECWADQGDDGRGKSKDARTREALSGSAGLSPGWVGLVGSASLSAGFLFCRLSNLALRAETGF